jgi:hypothetical protein
LSGSGKRSAAAILQITELISGRMTLLLNRGQNQTMKLSPLKDTYVYLFHQTLQVICFVAILCCIFLESLFCEMTE